MRKNKKIVRRPAVRSDWLWIGLALAVLVVAWLPLASGSYLSPVKRVEARSSAEVQQQQRGW